MSNKLGCLWYFSITTQQWDRCDEVEAWGEDGSPNNDYVDALFNDIDQLGGVHLRSQTDGVHQHWIATRNGDVVGYVL